MLKLITLLSLTLIASSASADYFYTYSNTSPLIQSDGLPGDEFDDYLYGSITFATNMALEPSSTYDIGTRYSGTFETIFTRYVGFNLSGNKFDATYSYLAGYVTTDEHSQIVEWNIGASIPEPWGYGTTNTEDRAYYFGGNSSMLWLNAGGGNWSLTVQAIPEPSASIFFLVGLMTLSLLVPYKMKRDY